MNDFENWLSDDEEEESEKDFEEDSTDRKEKTNLDFTEEPLDPKTRTINLGKENFSKFLSITTVVSKLCQDLSIKDGKVSQSSDRKTSILCADLSSILGKAELLMSRISVKTELLIPFRNQQVEMDLIIEQEERSRYIFKDRFSQLTFDKPLQRYLSNDYLTDEEVSYKLSLDERGSIFDCEFSKFIVERLAAFSKGLEAHELRLELKDGKAHFRVSSRDGTSSSRVLTVKDLNRKVTGVCDFPITPFLLVEKMDITCFLRKREDEGSKQTIFLRLTSDVEEIPLSIWVLAFLDGPGVE